MALRPATFRRVCGPACLRREGHSGDHNNQAALVYRCTECKAVSHLHDLGGSSKHHCGGWFQAQGEKPRKRHD